MKELNKSHCIILPVVWVGEEYVVEPNGWVDERYVDPVFSLLPVQPPKSIPSASLAPSTISNQLITNYIIDNG